MEESRDSSDESDRPEGVKDETSTGRFYECTFCKRGFSTAQALGGHMNIHRRDRARMRQPSLPSVPNKPVNEPPVPNSGFSPPQLPNYPFFPSLNYQHAYLPTSTSSSRHAQSFHGDDLSARVPPPPRQLSLFGEDWNPGPSARARNREEKKEEDESELDLELRLGPEP
ncbi:hypothetical protein AAC387_Pa11g0152 [Persea americana]